MNAFSWKNISGAVALLVLYSMLPMEIIGQAIERVVVCETNDADQLNPFTNFSATGSYINEYLYASLLRSDKSTGAFVPLLAVARPEISDDLLSYTYTLNPEAAFNGGKKVTSRDVVFSFKMLRNQYVNNHQKRSHYDAIVNVVPLNEAIVMFQIAKPQSQAMRITGEFPIVSADFFDPEGRMDSISLAELRLGDKVGMNKLQVLKTIAERINLFGSSLAAYHPDATCGSYVLSEWRRGAEIVLTANKRFWGRKLPAPPNDFFKQNVAEIRFEITTDELQIRQGLFDNHFDLLSSPANVLFVELSQMPVLAEQYRFLSPPGPSYEYIGLNMKAKARQRNPALEELAVRQALARLVHVDLLMVQICSGIGTRIASDCPASRPDYREDLPMIPFDIARANQMLDQAGWKDTDGNDLRDKNIGGEDVQLVLECIVNENKPERKKIAEHLQANAREAGILVVITVLPWKDYLTRLKAGDFDINIGAWVSDPNENSYRQIWHRKSWGKGSNFVGFGTETTDRLIKEYDETIDPKKHKALSQAIQRAIYDAQPYIFLWANNQCLVLNKRFPNAPDYALRPGFWIAAWE